MIDVKYYLEASHHTQKQNRVKMSWPLTFSCLFPFPVGLDRLAPFPPEN